jgi:hypothetical protein
MLDERMPMMCLVEPESVAASVSRRAGAPSHPGWRRPFPGFGPDPRADRWFFVVGFVIDESHLEREATQLVPPAVMLFRCGQLVEHLEQSLALPVRQCIYLREAALQELDRHVRVDLVVIAGVQPPHEIDEEPGDGLQRRRVPVT